MAKTLSFAAPLLAAAGILLAFASLAPHAPLRSFAADTLAHFPLQYVLLSLLLAAAGWIAGSHIALGAGAFALVLNLAALAPYLPHRSVSSTGAEKAEKIVILQANMLYRNRSIDGLMAAIEDEDPDIIILCEANTGHAAYLRDIMRHYPYQHATVNNKNSFGMAVASRIPLDEITPHHLSQANVVSYGIRLRAMGEQIYILSAHTANPLKNFPARNQELAALAARAAQENGAVLLAGDLNITPYAQHYRDLIRTAKLASARQGRGLNGSYPSWLPAPLRLPIDHVLWRGEGFRILDHRVRPLAGSDHMATVTHLGRAP